MKEGGLDGVFFTAPLLGGQDEGPKGPERILEDLGAIVQEVQRYGDLAEIARLMEATLETQGGLEKGLGAVAGLDEIASF